MGWFSWSKKDYRVDYSKKILDLSLRGANLMRRISEKELPTEQRKKISDVKWLRLVFEYIFFYLHLTDRLAFGRIDEQKRREFMPSFEFICITSAVMAISHKLPEEDVQKLKTACLNDFDVSSQKYNSFDKFYSEKDESLKDTLFWEFGKEIAKISGHGIDIRFVGASHIFVCESLKELNINSFIEKVKKT